ncbi:MAG: alpha-glucan family phosphorylase [Candidatus Omnitrophica bacterium]|nr:alpha-glucan family phosphorylase [Candidatus Omnitrophota bacterium]
MPEVNNNQEGNGQPIVKKKRKEDRKIAYFSMEIGINSRIPTYSGGLGVLAGDTIRSCADLNVPVVAVTLLYKKGYFAQRIDAQGQQSEMPHEWNPQEFLELLPEKVSVEIEQRVVYIQAWMYKLQGASDYFVPVLFLDTDLEENAPSDRTLTHYLYGGDERYRLAQEIVLGIGGVRMLSKLEYENIIKYHMNEGHASLLALELLKQTKFDDEHWDIEGVRKMCLFTTHTPVPAGHDQFSYELAQQMLGEYVPLDLLKSLGGEGKLNMTHLALNLSDYVNGVAKQHGKVSKEMFPGYHIDSITNGVHSATWVCPSFKDLYDTYIPGWVADSFSLRYALSIPRDQIWQAHMAAKRALVDYVNNTLKAGLDPEVFTIGFARRTTAYKRADLVFNDFHRLCSIAQRIGQMQFVFAGKAHPRDWPGKELIKKIITLAGELKDCIKVIYLENYDFDLAKVIIPGVDIWLNTPRRPQEASGTSGMKAAHNGVPSLSILDGWWIEGCIEGVTGWSIGSAGHIAESDAQEAESLYRKLEEIILPTFYNGRQQWIDVMRHAIAMNASFFNTQRMVQQYVLRAYL